MPPIWKIKNEPFWFAGTFHFLKKEDYPISDILQEAINIVELLVLEDKDFLVKGQNLGLYEGERDIHSELSSEAVNLLSNRCKDVGLDFNAIQKYRPWKATIMVSTTMWRSIGFSFENGLDNYLLDTFLSYKRPVISLEDSLETLLIFERLSREEQEKLLIKSLESIELMAEHMQNLHEAWKTGSEELVMKFGHEPLKIFPNLFRQLILERNTSWLPKIKKLINQKSSALVAVGTGHLFGESNIIGQLINVGYSIERLA